MLRRFSKSEQAELVARSQGLAGAELSAFLQRAGATAGQLRGWRSRIGQPVHRDPERTRAALLDAAHRLWRTQGYQATPLDELLAHAGLTSGALFHYFPSKLTLAYAVVEERVIPDVRAQWITPIARSSDCLQALLQQVRAAARAVGEGPFPGCPMSRLSQEMIPLDDGFRARFQALNEEWLAAYQAALERDRAAGRLAPDVRPAELAYTLVANIHGTLSLAQTSRSGRTLQVALRSLEELTQKHIS